MTTSGNRSATDESWLELFLPGPAEAERRRRLASWIRELRNASTPGGGVLVDRPNSQVSPSAGPHDSGQSLMHELAVAERLSELERELGYLLGSRLGPGAATTWARRELSGGPSGTTAGGGGQPASPHRAPTLRERMAIEDLKHQVDSAGRCDLWRLRRVHARRGPERALALLRQRFPAPVRAGLPLELRRDVLLDEVGLLLERRSAGVASELLDRHRVWIAGSASGAWMSGLVQLARGEFELAREQLFAGRRLGADLGRAWLELAQDDVRVEQCLRRGGWSAEPNSEPSCGRALVGGPVSRRSLGAAVLAVFCVEPGGELACLHEQIAPGARDAGACRALDDWRRQMRDALRDAGSPERICWLERRTVRLHLGSDRGGPGTAASLAGRSWLAPLRALVVAPVVDRLGEVRALIRLEFEHHLLPCAGELAALVEAVQTGSLLRARKSIRFGRVAETARLGWSSERDWPSGSLWLDPLSNGRQSVRRSAVLRSSTQALEPSEEDLTAAFELEDDPWRVAARVIWRQLAAKLGRRRVWFFDREHDEPWLEFGEELGLWRQRPGRRRALVGARELGEPVRFEDRSAELAVSADAACGVVFPLVESGLGGRWVAEHYLVIESARSGDLTPERVQNWQARLEGAGEMLARAGFRRTIRLELGVDLCDRALWPEPLIRLRQAAEAARPIAMEGPPGMGKKLLARWLQELAREAGAAGGRPRGPRRERVGGADTTPRDLEWVDLRSSRLESTAIDPQRWLDQAAHGSLVVLVGALPRWVQQSGALPIRLPALSSRRRHVPNLVRLLTQRAAQATGIAASRVTDEGLAVLWRQPWEGGIRQLGRVLRRWVVAQDGSLTASSAQRHLLEAGLDPVPRISSRRPDLEVVAEALATTVCRNGRPNKRRAARYLGWDPATLGKQLERLGPEFEPPGGA